MGSLKIGRATAGIPNELASVGVVCIPKEDVYFQG
jgi:hypothetical protein